MTSSGKLDELCRTNRWTRKAKATLGEDRAGPCKQRAAACPSYILQHYHSTGCCGGAFSWRAAMLDPHKEPFMCRESREYRETTMEDIQLSLEDKRRGGGPRVGPFQKNIPGHGWQALPKYDYTTRNRSTAFNERMHVEWENHVDHILQNEGQLPVASVVAKAGFRSCAPCCRDMLALARPTGKTFIMVDLAESNCRGTFHFVMGDKYLPIPKEACEPHEVEIMKNVVLDAQAGKFSSSQEIYDAMIDANLPVDETAQALYLGDRALLPAGCAVNVRGTALLEVIHAEHFARLPAEYGASIFRDAARPEAQREAVRQCRGLARDRLIAAWGHCLDKSINLKAYADAAVLPLLPEEPDTYTRLKLARKLPAAKPIVTSQGFRRWAVDGPKGQCKLTSENLPAGYSSLQSDDSASTAMPDTSSRFEGSDVDEDFMG